jgi:hypothetical protein
LDRHLNFNRDRDYASDDTRDDRLGVEPQALDRATGQCVNSPALKRGVASEHEIERGGVLERHLSSRDAVTIDGGALVVAGAQARNRVPAI